jgi:hypothetical protein
MRNPFLAAPACALAFAALACGSGSSPGDASGGGGPDGGSAAPAEPITGLTTGEWRWVPFPDSSCGDGSATGIGVNPGTGPDLVFFLNGGGACSSALTCVFLPTPTATLGPFRQEEFDREIAGIPESILDRTLSDNPFADATLVFVPYCTGDVHGGDRVVAYTDDPGGTVHHKGHANVLAFLERVAATYPSPRRLVVTGSSAGGFGALVNYEAIRSSFPSAQGFLVDDSGPPLESNGGMLIQAGFQNWGIGDVLDPLCGPGICEQNLSLGLAALIRNHPADRFALLSYDADSIISQFYGIGQADFTRMLLEMTSDVIDPAPTNARAFIKTGQYHTMLGRPGTVSQNGVPLVTWLAEEVTGSAGWSTVRPQ